jgi:threonine dehydrogenase-like Zn-dependent dehydrogenase
LKQILQNMKNGLTTIVDAPSPTVSKVAVLITTQNSLISSGTERMLVDFGRASLIDKARQQPDKVKMVLDKVNTDGLMTTVDAVRSKLGQPLPLGYCNVGRVLEVGESVDTFSLGDRVVSNGPHADVVKVGSNLCARIPDGVDDESANSASFFAIDLPGNIHGQIGTGENAKTGIVWYTIKYSFWGMFVFSAVISIIKIFKTELQLDLMDSVTTIASIFMPIITLALGYAFGSNSGR